MDRPKNKLYLTLHALSCLIAFVILMDFISPGNIINDEIVKIEQDLEPYYNASGNYHYSFKVYTNNHEFPVSEEFADLDLKNKNIEYTVSLIFKEINWYQLTDSNDKFYYSLRTYSGLILPLLVLIVIFMSYYNNKNIDILIFVLQVLLIADLIFLIV